MNDETPPTADRGAAWKWWLYEAGYILCLAVMTFGFSYRFRGRRHVPKTGPVLVVANHQSFLDPILVGLAVRRHMVPLARKTLFRNPFFTWLIRSLNAVPIDQEGIAKEGLKAILEQLERGKLVVVFPEGERTPDGSLGELKPGIYLLIKRARAAIVPVGIAGAFAALPRSRTRPQLAPLFWPPNDATIGVAVGPPLDAAKLASLPRAEVLAELRRELAKVCADAERLRRK
jgi:1-acyl-sn-glycerol-3-phosphate acyltransferase